MRSFRSKPAGWRHESYRHYLASKGIASKMPKYLAAKGIRMRYFDTEAWPWGKGQQRFKKVLKSRVDLEPAVIPIHTEKRFKSYDFPVTEEEIKQQLEEKYTTEELGTGPTKVVLADTEGLYPANAKGRAFRHGGIKIYGRKAKRLEGQEGFQDIRGLTGRGAWESKEVAKESALQHTLPHEIAHIRLGHLKWESPHSRTEHMSREIDADIAAAEWRRRTTGHPDSSKGSYIHGYSAELAELQDMSKSKEEFLRHRRRIQKGLGPRDYGSQTKVEEFA